VISSQHARTVASLSFLSDSVRPTAQTHTMSNTYQRLPTEDGPSVGDNDNEGVSAQTPEPDYSHRPLRAASQAEFNRPPPSWWKRALLILSLVFMLWLTLKLGGMGNQKSKVIYASRFVFPCALAGSCVALLRVSSIAILFSLPSSPWVSHRLQTIHYSYLAGLIDDTTHRADTADTMSNINTVRPHHP